MVISSHVKITMGFINGFWYHLKELLMLTRSHFLVMKKHENRLKKGYIEMSKWNYLETQKGVLGRSKTHYFEIFSF